MRNSTATYVPTSPEVTDRHRPKGDAAHDKAAHAATLRQLLSEGFTFRFERGVALVDNAGDVRLWEPDGRTKAWFNLDTGDLI